MRTRSMESIGTLAAVLIFSSVAVAQPRPNRHIDVSAVGWGATKATNLHDLSGVWTRVQGSGNMGDDIPAMTPLGKERFDANIPAYGPRGDSVHAAVSNDPLTTCDPLGLTRNVFLEIVGRSFEFVQIPGRVLQFFEWAHQYRTIWTDGRELPTDPQPRWMGYSVGKWEGDTFVVDSASMDERSWLDMWGRPHSDALRVQERYRRVDHETLELVVRIEDPKIFTTPWESEPKIHWLNPEKGMNEKLETMCVPSEEQDFGQRLLNPAGVIK